MTNFSRTRCVELSLIKYIEETIEASWSGITVVKAFTNAYSVAVPVIAVYMVSTNSARHEIGSSTLRNEYVFSIDIFAKSDGQRLDLADFIMNAIKNGCVYYDFSRASGAPETLNEVEDGRLTFLNISSNSKVEGGDYTQEHERWRHNITFSVGKL